MHYQALTVWSGNGVSHLSEEYWCLKYCKKHTDPILLWYMHAVYALNQAHQLLFSSYTCAIRPSLCSGKWLKSTHFWNTAKNTQDPLYHDKKTQHVPINKRINRYLDHAHRHSLCAEATVVTYLTENTDGWNTAKNKLKPFCYGMYMQYWRCSCKYECWQASTAA